jgi:ATP-dependent HslUV protease ATP-binding subunit HslU
VGYVGRDVEQMIRDLVEAGIVILKDKKRAEVKAKAHLNAEERVIDALVGQSATPSTRDAFRKKLRANELDDKEIEIEVPATAGNPMFDMPGMPGGGIGMINLSDMFGKAFGGRTQKRTVKVKDAYEPLINQEADKLLDQDKINLEAIELVENHGIVFIDEIDKVAAKEGGVTGGPSREGVQRDLLPLIEGTTVSTKYGPVNTDHILFIASGAFHVSKPSDLLPELQGRLPIRVELRALTREDFIRILSDTEYSLIRQYVALMGTENVTLEFTPDAIEAVADIAVSVNSTVENIGARRLQTVLEKLVEDISFDAPDKGGTTLTIDGERVRETVGKMAGDIDLSRYIL